MKKGPKKICPHTPEHRRIITALVGFVAHRIAIEGLSVESDADLLRGAHDQGIREATETMVQHVRTTLLLIPCATERYRIRLEKAYKAINR